MAGRPPRRDEPDHDAAAAYLRRLQGDETSTAAPQETVALAGSEGAAAPLEGSADEATRRYPGAPPPDWESSLPPGAPLSIVSADTVLRGSDTGGRQIPQLPTWFLSDGLQLLRKGDYRGAQAHYEALTRQAPSEAEGWLGLGAARQGLGDLRQAVEHYLKGLELDEHLFPLAALAVEATPGKPTVLFDVATGLGRHESRRALRTAMSLFEEVMASATTSRRLYEKADDGRRAAKDKVEWLEAKSNPALLSLKQTASRQKRWQRVLRTVVILLAVTGASWLGWFGYHRARAETLYQQGQLAFMQGHRIATYGAAKLGATDGRDAYDLYSEALEKFRESAVHRPEAFPTNFMIMRSGQQALRHLAKHFGSEKTPPERAQQLQQQIQQAEAFCRKVDPAGGEAKRQQILLDNRLAAMH